MKKVIFLNKYILKEIKLLKFKFKYWESGFLIYFYNYHIPVSVYMCCSPMAPPSLSLLDAETVIFLKREISLIDGI